VLNRDMQLIIEKVKPLAPAGGQSEVEAVRTDFSLYGLTKH
jgi:hypothetical protein